METTRKISLKILIDRKGERVLFAEAEKEFVDFLFQIFSLPLGSVVSILAKENMVGCLGKLYGSIENLSNTYMQPCANKDNVLNPKIYSTDAPLLLSSESASNTIALYRCPTTSFADCRQYASDNPEAICPRCKAKLTQKLTYVPAGGGNVTGTGEGGYVKGVVTYMIMDDLEVRPMSAISSIALLSKFNVTDLGALEEKIVVLTPDEGMKLLKASLQSKTVLTDMFLGEASPIQLAGRQVYIEGQ